MDEKRTDAAADVDAYLAGLFHRTTMLLGQSGMDVLRGKTVAVAGCGGVGGAGAITLARLGVGGFVLADPGIFDPPDGNRQWACSRATLGRNKTEVHAEWLRQINPNVRLKLFPEGVTEANLDDFLSSADLLLDCLDISVPQSLRGRVYRTAQARGMYAVSAPIFGFGTMVLFAEPGGMGMDELIAGFVKVASTESKLPPGFPDHYFPPHVEAVEREIYKHRVPTSGIAVTIASGVVAAEIARIFLKEEYPGLDGPTVLPNVLAVEPLRRTYKVLHYTELFRDARPSPDRAARERALTSAGGDVVRLANADVAADFLTDSWAHLGTSSVAAGSTGAGEAAGPHLEERIRRLYGVPHAVAVAKGRLAEAILAPLVVKPGLAVASVAPFVTTRHHVEAAGGRILDVRGPDPTSADVDVDALARALAEGSVGAVWLESCNDALGGRPLTLGNLRRVRELATSAGIPVVLDTCRIWENAVLLQGSEDEARSLSTADVVSRITSLADACAGSLTKDVRAPLGGMIAVRDEALAAKVRWRTLLTAEVDDGQKASLAAALAGAGDTGRAAEERVLAVRALADALEAVGAPVVRPVGGHAVFLDVSDVSPFAGDARPDLAFCRAVYLASGARVGPAFASPPGRWWVRCAVPLGGDRRLLDVLVAGVKDVLAGPVVAVAGGAR